MKTSFALAGVTYDLVSLENGRALFRCAPYTSFASTTTTRSIEISHLDSKNGQRRSMIKVTVTNVEDSPTIPANGTTQSCHLVVTSEVRGGTQSANASQSAFNALGEFAFGVDETDFQSAFGIMRTALTSGTFVPDTYVDPSA